MTMAEQGDENGIPGKSLYARPGKFDLDLFLQLNEEYRDKPAFVTRRRHDTPSRTADAEQRALMLEERVGLRGRKVLEVGCGAGDVAAILARDYDCEVTAVDIQEYPSWEGLSRPKLTFRVVDITEKHDLEPESFDRIISLVVWEHIQHPYAGLKACRDLLRPDGRFYLRANLYLSPIASHRYRDVFFPWPHLLFSDEVFAQFSERMGTRANPPPWLNRLTHAHYQCFFDLLGFRVEQEWLSRMPLDKDFYVRFHDLLSRYPVFDLTLKFFDVMLAKGSSARSEPSAPIPQLGRRYVRELASIEQRAAELEALTEVQTDELAALGWQAAEEAAERERAQAEAGAWTNKMEEEKAARKRAEEELSARENELRSLASELSELDAAVAKAAGRLPDGVRCPQSARETVEAINSLLNRRVYKLARRLSRRPRNLGYWFTLPVDIVRIALRRDSEGGAAA